METEKFNFEARRKEWPLIEEAMSHFDHDQLMALLKSNARSSRTGCTITLYKDYRQSEVALKASVMFGLYAPTYRFDALHILLNYLEETNRSVEWDAVSFSGDKRVFPRAMGFSLLDPSTSDIAHYARIGLRASLKEISSLPSARKISQVFNAFLANTAIVDTHSTRPVSAADLKNILEEVVKNAITEQHRPKEPTP